MVKLVAITQGAGNLVNKTAQEVISYVTRVSNPNNQLNFDTAPKLLAYCIKNQHWSPFEHASFTVEIITSRGIAAQILRHRSFTFQEFCISGDSKITTLYKNSKGKLVPNYIKISKLYEKQHFKNYKNIKVRVYDSTNKKFTTASIKEVFKTGKKEAFKITLEDGKNITATKEHKFLTKKGFLSMEQALNMKFNAGKVSLENPMLIASNGIPCHHSYEWMKEAKERSIKNKKGLSGIAKEASVSYHTIRKWLKIFNLQFTKKEISLYTPPWNKNKIGYKNKPRTLESRLKQSLNTPKGANHHSYKGGAASKRKAIANFFNPLRKQILQKFNFECQMCKMPLDNKTDLHHIKEVGLYPELAYCINNVIPVHRKCHMNYHGKSYYFKQIRKGHKGNTLVPKFQKVVNIEYVGEIETYDMEVNHSSHNYIANKIVVHNSQRYSVAYDYVEYYPRRQDLKNKQNSVDDMSEADKDWFCDAQKQVWELSNKLYQDALDKKIAKEQARFLLPLNTQTTLYMTGSVRSWIHYCQLRCDKSTQKEHRDIAEDCKTIFIENFPDIAKALGWVK